MFYGHHYYSIVIYFIALDLPKLKSKPLYFEKVFNEILKKNSINYS